MLTQLETDRKVVGVKQSRKAVKDGQALCAVVAEDAQDHVRKPFETICHLHSVPITYVPTCVALGKACGIAVGAAVAVVLKP